MTPHVVPFARVKLGASEATRVHDTRLRSHVRSLVASAFRVKHTDRLVPPLPITAEAHHIELFASLPFVFTEKADGQRFIMLLFTTLVNQRWEKICALWARDDAVFILPLCIGDRLFQHGCTFDCELVQTWDGRNELLVFDTYVFEGVHLKERPFTERCLYTAKFVEECYAHTPGDMYRLRLKRFVSLRNCTAAFVERIEQNNSKTRTFDYPTDGVIVMQSNVGISAGTNRTMFKFKKIHTLDLLVTKDEPPNDGLISLQSVCVDHRQTYLTPHKTAIAIEKLPHGATVGSIVECACEIDQSGNVQIEMMHVREDKSEPNATWVVERTIQTIRDAVDFRLISGMK